MIYNQSTHRAEHEWQMFHKSKMTVEKCDHLPAITPRCTHKNGWFIEKVLGFPLACTHFLCDISSLEGSPLYFTQPLWTATSFYTHTHTHTHTHTGTDMNQRIVFFLKLQLTDFGSFRLMFNSPYISNQQTLGQTKIHKNGHKCFFQIHTYKTPKPIRPLPLKKTKKNPK